jgi:hypothetical protein
MGNVARKNGETGIAMGRFAHAWVSVLLLAAAGLGAGCSSAGGIVTGSTPAAAGAPSTAGPGKAARRGNDKFGSDEFWEEMKTRGSQ